MRFKQIVENSTTAGSVASVAKPMMTQTRENTNVRGLKPVQQVIKGKAVKKGPYANSIVESKVTEDDLAEQDLIVIPGQGRLKRTGFVKHDLDKGEHEGETLKNSLHTIIRVATHLDKRLSTSSEFPEWVSEKIGAVKSNMVNVMDYLISSQEMQHDSDAMNEGSQRVDSIVTDALKVMKGPEMSDAVLALKRVLGDRAYNERRGFYSFYVDQIHDMYNQQGVAEGMGGQTVFTGTGADGGKYEVIQTGPTDFMIHANDKHIDTYSSLARAMSVLKNEVPGLETSVAEAGDTAKGQKMLAKVHNRAADRVTSKQADKDPAYARKAQQTQDRAWDRLAVKEQGVAEGYNDLGREYGGAYVKGRSDDARMTERLTKQAKAAAAKAGKTFNTSAEYRKWHAQQKEKQGVAEGSIKDVEAKIRTHDQRKADREQAGDPYVAHEIHSHNVIRKQLLDKRKRVQAAYHKKMDQQGVAEGIDTAWDAAKAKVNEGAKVDRMVKHVKKSEKKLGHSDKEAENIAWATANKRGMLDNKNKKK